MIAVAWILVGMKYADTPHIDTARCGSSDTATMAAPQPSPHHKRTADAASLDITGVDIMESIAGRNIANARSTVVNKRQYLQPRDANHQADRKSTRLNSSHWE